MSSKASVEALTSDGAHRYANRTAWVTAASSAGLALFAYVAICSMETSTPNFDPQFMRVLVERTAAYGGSYYSNGIHNKGPLEPFLYSLALHLGGADGFWFVIACFTFVAAVCVALGGAAVVIVDRGTTLTASCVMALIVAYLTISRADYAGVLYSRNISVALLSIAFFVGVLDAAWSTQRRRKVAALIVAVALGLSVQTLISGMFTAAAVMLWVMWWRRRDRAWGLPIWLAVPVIAALTFLSAPIYYLIVGPWDDFVAGFWTHARYMSIATGRGLLGQFALGWRVAEQYYLQRPEVAIFLLAWEAMVVVAWRGASPAQRSVRLMLFGWWCGAWTELALSQRYSSHYFSVLAVPTMLMFADLLTQSITWLTSWAARSSTNWPGGWSQRWDALRARLAPAKNLLPLLCVIGVMVAEGTNSHTYEGVQAAAMVRSVDQFTERRELYREPRIATTRAALDLISQDGDALLMWTSFPWPYLDLHRVSATRYIWKSFMVGEIYLGDTSDRYVLPGTWSNFSDDLAQSNPQAFLVETVTPVKKGTPFAEYVDANFTPIYVDKDETLSFRNEIVDQLRAEPTDPRDVELAQQTVTQMCERVDGVFRPDTTTVIVVWDSNGESLARLTIDVHADSLDTNVHREGRVDAENHVSIDGDPEFTLIAGARAVALMVDGRIVAALDSDPEGFLHWETTDVVGPVSVSPSPSVTGCGRPTD